MKSETKIEFLRAGLITSLQGENINNLQHLGITTSGPMDYFLSKIGNLIMENNEDDLTFEICKFGPIIKVIEGSFIFLISGNINFKIINNSNSQKGECFKSYILKKGDILEINQTINSNYAYLIFKGELNGNVSSEYRSTIVSSSLGLNDGKKISDFDKFNILNFSFFRNRSLPFSLINFYDNESIWYHENKLKLDLASISSDDYMVIQNKYNFISGDAYKDIKGNSSLLPQEVVFNVSQMKIGESRLIETDDGIYHLTVNNINLPNATYVSEVKEEYTEFANTQSRSGIIDLLNDQLYTNARINVNIGAAN